MSDLYTGIQQLTEPEKSIGTILIEFYDTMKELEKDENRGGKQATKVIMTMNEIMSVFT